MSGESPLFKYSTIERNFNLNDNVKQFEANKDQQKYSLVAPFISRHNIGCARVYINIDELAPATTELEF